MTIGAEGEPDTGVPSTPNESVVGAIPIGDLGGAAGGSKGADGALLALRGPKLLQWMTAKREGQQGGMRQHIHRHLAREALEIRDVRLHILVRGHVWKPARERVNERAVRQPDAVQ